jgi:ligand-binding SRPBCC domain-containing protein
VHVGLKIVLDAPVDTVRDAFRSPAVMVAVTRPFLVYRSLAPEGFPDRWTPGEPQPITASAFGLLPSGDTHVDLELRDVDGVPVQVDRGGGTSGLFARMTMRHRMAATPLPDGRTLLRDRLTYRMRPAVLGLALWPGMWVIWQWRAMRMRALAPSWRGDTRRA